MGRRQRHCLNWVGLERLPPPHLVLPTLLPGSLPNFGLLPQITLVFLALFPGISPRIWKRDCWLPGLEDGEG